MHWISKVCAALLPLSLCAACAEAPAEEPGAFGAGAEAFITANGITLNGITLNGITLNGITLNGITLNGITLNGITLNGTQLHGQRSDDGSPVRGDAFEGATLTGALSNGDPVTLLIDAIDPSSDPEISLYTVLYQSGSQWKGICGESNGVPLQAIPLAGQWDYSQGTPTGGDHIDDPGVITFACEGSALAKCTTLGYKPWKTAKECRGADCKTVPLRPLHQACTRMIRADYCGDGASHTRDGTPLNLWDNFGIQVREQVTDGWLKEAEWSMEGATCVEHVRYDTADIEASAYIHAHCPERWSAPATCFRPSSTFQTAPGYNAPLATRSLLRNEFDHAYPSANE